MLIYHANVLPITSAPIEDGFVLVEHGRIADFGDMSRCPAPTAGDIHAGGLTLLPGFVDPHCHLGLFPDGQDYDGADACESSDPITPELRALDGINPLDPTFREAREGGVTTVVVGPGSANPIAGQMCALKTAGCWVDDMVVKSPCAMKLALGENPKGVHGERTEAPMTRMATAALLRENLRRAQDYAAVDRGENVDYDPKLEALAEVVRGRLPVQFHALRSDDLATAVRISEEFGLKYTLVHATEGYLVAEKLAEKGVRVIAGPMMNDRSKAELARQTMQNPALLNRAGVEVAICSDHPENAVQYLPIGAGLCVRSGLPRQKALESITITAARLTGIDHRVGSIEVGKDADLVLWDGDPLSNLGRPLMVWIDGKRV